MLTVTSSDKIYVEFVDVPERLRPINEERVEAIAQSMKEIGLQTPISVRDINDGERIVLVAGRHRLEAATRLGWEKTPSSSSKATRTISDCGRSPRTCIGPS